MASFATEEPKSTKQKILEAGASLLQSKDPIKSFKQHLISVAFINGDTSKQFLLHHYLNTFNDEFAHALLYDNDHADAKLVGIQYIISEKVFTSLPEQEKKLWYSFQYMVKNGLIVAPSLPSMAEKPLMTHLSSCYGKTFLFWQTQNTPLPYGIPQLMMGFTNQGQVNELLLKEMYSYSNTNVSELLRKREKLPTTVIHSGADSWQQGEVFQLRLERVGGSSGYNQGVGPNQLPSSQQYSGQQQQQYGNTPSTNIGTAGYAAGTSGYAQQSGTSGGSSQHGAPYTTSGSEPGYNASSNQSNLNSGSAYNQSGQSTYGQPGQSGQSGQSTYGQPGQSAYGQSGQSTYPGQSNQSGQSAHGQSGQSAYGQSDQSSYGQPNQSGQSTYPDQSNQSGQSAYGQSDQSSYGQPNQSGQSAYGQSGQTNPAGYGQSGQSSYGQPNQSGQSSGQPGQSSQSAYGQSGQSGVDKSIFDSQRHSEESSSQRGQFNESSSSSFTSDVSKVLSNTGDQIFIEKKVSNVTSFNPSSSTPSSTGISDRKTE